LKEWTNWQLVVPHLETLSEKRLGNPYITKRFQTHEHA
jgi:hypothetical protein